MTIGSTIPARVSFNCDGVTTVFPIPIQAYQASDITVVLTAPTSSGGAETTLVLNSDYSMAAAGTLNPQQWTLTTLHATPYAAGYTLQAFINPVQAQQTSYVQNQAFPSLALQTNLDRLTQMVQRLQDQVNRAVRAPDGDVSPGMIMGPATQRALQFLGFDSNGNAIAVPQLPGSNVTRPSIGAVLYPQTTAESVAGVVPANIYIPSHDAAGYVHLKRYGGAGDGATINNAAFANAVLVAGQIDAPIVFTYDVNGIWLFSNGITANGSGQTQGGIGPPVGGVGAQGCRLWGIGPSITLRFTGLSGTTDCLTVGGGNTPQVEVRNLHIDCNNTGQDGLVITGSNKPILENVWINKPVRDGFVVSVSGFADVEKADFDVRVQSAGRNGVRFQLSGANGAFINEVIFRHLEVRGYSQNTPGGRGLYFTSAATGGGSQFGNIQLYDSQFDWQYVSGPNQPSANVIECDSGNVNNLVLLTGGWENTGGTLAVNSYLLAATGTGTISQPVIQGLVLGNNVGAAGLLNCTPALWLDYLHQRVQMTKIASLFGQPTVLEDLQLFQNGQVFNVAYGIRKSHVKATADGAPASQTDGLAYDGFLHSSVNVGTSSTGNLDFVFAVMSPNPGTDFPHIFELLLGHSQFAATGNVIQRKYMIMVRPDLATVVATQIADASTANEISSVAFSVVNSTTFRVAITTGTAHGTGGGNTIIYGTLARGSFTK